MKALANPRSNGPSLARRVLRAALRLFSSSAYRVSLRMRLLPTRGGFQPFNQTATDRYPVIFGFVRDTLGADRDVRLLSFGCSTGEEVCALRRHFPRAFIKGIDINAGNIAACLRKLRRHPDLGAAFEHASSTRAEVSQAYDAIFCMAVMRDGRLARSGVARCDHLIRFEDFAHMVEDFHRCLKPGGLLVIRHSNFRLCDAPVGARFEPIFRRAVSPRGATPIFGPDNRLMPGVQYPDTVFRRMS
jgi:SAM-dependent methyltransferase